MTIANGVWPVMITPYTENNEIDWEGIKELLKWYAERQVTGVFAVCQSSEMFELTHKERVALARFVVDNAPKGMTVIASGHVADDPKEQLREAQEMIDTGIFAYVFVSNRFASADESIDTMKRRMEYMVNHLNAQNFGIYECPYPYKRLMTPGLLKWCADTGRFSFLKDTCCNLSQIKAKLEAVKGTNLKIFNANAATLLESLKMGCAGYSGVMANFHPELYVWLYQNYATEPELAERMQDFLGAASMVETQCYPVNSKYYLQLEGLPITRISRKKNQAFTESRKMEIEQFRRITLAFREMSLRGKL